MRALLLAAALLAPAAAPAQVAPAEHPQAPAAAPAQDAKPYRAVVAVRPLRARSRIEANDVALRPSAAPGPFEALEDVIGMEARSTIYAGRQVHPSDIGPAALVERNALVSMQYQTGGLSIVAEGRALGRAGIGEPVRVMNLDSRATVTARVVAPGVVEVR
jgi:flagella basal body P-ring formation protein FlgA